MQTPLVHVEPEPQMVHEFPFAPQACMVVPGWQVLPLQHPDGQLVESQTQAIPPSDCAAQRAPALHCAPPPQAHVPAVQASASPEPQVVHTAPPSPQADSEVPWAQLLPLQQPVQLVVSQTQVPPVLQRSPNEHCGLLPHRQAPLDEQLSDRVLEHCWQLCAMVPQWPRVGGL